MSAPPLGPERPAMDLTCGRLTHPGYCGEPAAMPPWDAVAIPPSTYEPEGDVVTQPKRGCPGDRHLGAALDALYPEVDGFPKRCQCDRNGVRCDGLVHAPSQAFCPDCLERCADRWLDGTVAGGAS